MMVDDIWPNHQRTEHGGILGAVGVFQPMEDPGQKIGEQDDAEGLEEDLEGLHGVLIAGYFTPFGPRPVNRYS